MPTSIGETPNPCPPKGSHRARSRDERPCFGSQVAWPGDLTTAGVELRALAEGPHAQTAPRNPRSHPPSYATTRTFASQRYCRTAQPNRSAKGQQQLSHWRRPSCLRLSFTTEPSGHRFSAAGEGARAFQVTGSRFVQLSAGFVRSFADLGDAMRLGKVVPVHSKARRRTQWHASL
jgi:hypothetical protein